MAVPRHDPRANPDRVYGYGEYKVLSTQFKRAPRPRHGMLAWVGTDTKAQRRPIRLTYGVLLGLAIVVTLACIALAVYLESDSLRLAYAAQDLRTSLASLDQSLAETQTQNLTSESKVLAEGAKPQGVVYPKTTKFIVLTNIPEAAGASLVADLYPLSRKLIKIQP